jgi:hypothetical protein
VAAASASSKGSPVQIKVLSAESRLFVGPPIAPNRCASLPVDQTFKARMARNGVAIWGKISVAKCVSGFMRLEVRTKKSPRINWIGIPGSN